MTPSFVPATLHPLRGVPHIAGRRDSPEAVAARPALLRLLVAFALALAVIALTMAPALAQQPPSPGSQVGAATSPPLDPASTEAAPPGPDGGGGLLERVVRELLEEFKRWWELGFVGYTLRAVLAVLGLVGGFLYGLLDSVCCGSLNFVTRTPPALSYESPAVVALWATLRAVANAALAVTAMWGGFNVILHRHLGTPYHGAMELLPRLVVGALLANTSLWWGAMTGGANNDLCQLVGLANPFPEWARLSILDRASADGIALLVYAVVGVLLLLQQAARLALVDLLLAVAPLAMVCWVLPQTQRWASLWSGTFARVVFLQFLQAVALKLGASLLGSSGTAGGSLPAPLLILFGAAVLGLTLKLPGLLQAQVGDGLGFARYYAYRQGARALEGGRGGSGGAGRATARAAQAAPLPPPARVAVAGLAAARRR